jgi:hypothetical protein
MSTREAPYPYIFKGVSERGEAPLLFFFPLSFEGEGDTGSEDEKTS